MRVQSRNQSNAHLVLKQKASNFLRNKGYRVFCEYDVRVEGKLYRVDVIGFKNEHNIAIECGRTQRSKIIALKKVFDEVERFYYDGQLNPKKGYVIVEEKLPEKVEGTILGVRQPRDRFRVQIPKEVREKLGLHQNDRVYWVEFEGRIYVTKAVDIKGERIS